MVNIQNLKPTSERTLEERRELAKLGGKASVLARRKRKALREQLRILLSGETEDGKS